MKDVRTMKDDLIQCLTLLLLGLGIWAPFIPKDIKEILMPALLVLYVGLGLASMWLRRRRRRLSPAEQRDLERESRDERAQMIRDRAAWYCWTVELLVLMAVLCILVFSDCEFAYVVYWITFAHYCLFIAMRWWLNRKY